MCPINQSCSRPAPSTCLICLDFLLAYDNTDTARDAMEPSDLLRPVVALKCGHLFHTACVIDWFKNSHGKNKKLKPCPICRQEMRWCDTKRYIPIPYYLRRNSDDILQNLNPSHYRPAPSVCVICNDFLLAYASPSEIDSDSEPVDPSGSDSKLKPIVALKCGHLFHTSCVNKHLFKSSSQGENHTVKSCPYCKREMWQWDIKRIFPVSSGEE